jgi:hypothetical protein
MGLFASLYAVAGCMFVLGLALAVSNLTWTNVLQDKVPSELLGRVASINLLGSTSLLPIGLALAGKVTEAWGAPSAFIIGGVLTAAFAGMGLVLRSVRALD